MAAKWFYTCMMLKDDMEAWVSPSTILLVRSSRPSSLCLQIVVHKKSGFSIDPYHGEAAAELMADFFEASAKDAEHWMQVSRASLARIKEKYALLSFPILMLDAAVWQLCESSMLHGCCTALSSLVLLYGTSKNPT